MEMPERDLDRIVERVDWSELKGARLFITGGTGFFGRWLVQSFQRANRKHGLGAHAAVLTRNPGKAAEDLSFVMGDVRDFALPPGTFSHIIHAATPASAKLADENPNEMRDTIVRGTERVLELARKAGTKKLLLCSSGAVYGPQPTNLANVPEDFAGSPDPALARSSYGIGKRESEALCLKEPAIETKIARGFAFVGPGLPLDIHFAIGNFIGDAIARRPITVQGDGTPLRSYQYASDLAVWLWTILFKGANGRAYNVGSPDAISVGDLARKVGKLFDIDVQVLGKPIPGAKPARYVPATARAEKELGLKNEIELDEAIRRTYEFHANQSR